MIASSLPEHTPKLTKLGIYVTPAEKFHNLLSSSISTTRCHYNQGKCILAYNSQFPFHFPAHFRLPFFSANSWNVANLLFRTPPRRFHRFAPNFCRPSWQKVIKRTLTFQTILKLLNDNCTFCSKHKVLHISTLFCPNDMKLRSLLPHEPLRLCAKFSLFDLKYFISQHRLVGLRQNLVKFLPMPSWGQLTKLLPIRH